VIATSRFCFLVLALASCSRAAESPPPPAGEVLPLARSESPKEQPCAVTVDSDSAEVLLESGQLAVPHLTDETNHEEVTLESDAAGRSLHVQSKTKSEVVRAPGRIKVSVPPGCDVEVTSMSAGIGIADFGCTRLEVSSMSGDISAAAVGSQHTVLKSMSGNVRVTAAVATGAHLLRSMSGNVTVQPSPGSTVRLTVVSEKSFAVLNAESVRSGKLEAVVGTGTASMEARSVSGTVKARY
jgi:DUF4097 and DUF4098 domain-containing protein YvlB